MLLWWLDQEDVTMTTGDQHGTDQMLWLFPGQHLISGWPSLIENTCTGLFCILSFQVTGMGSGKWKILGVLGMNKLHEVDYTNKSAG